MSFEFDETYYLKSKLAQLQASDAQYASWSTDDVKKAILDAGFADVQAHYDAYSLIEGTSGSPYFNTTEYLEAKVHQLNSMKEGDRTDWTVDDVIKAFQDAGFTSAEDHYNMYGCKETDADGKLINPSNAFDANAYVAAKLAQLQATDPETYGDWTAADVAEAIADAGMSPVSHYEDYGKAEGEATNIDMVQTVPVVERVANDQLRDAMGENVPSNYNAATAAPKDVTEGTSVAKPCDMGDDDTVKPSDPVATPADVNYVAVPGNGIEDSNEKPVELVSASTQDAQGNDVTVSQYGVTETAEDGSTTTKAVSPNGTVADDAATIKTVSADGNTTTTDVKQGSTEISQTAVTNGDTTITTTNASLNGGNNTVTQTSTETTASDGSKTTDTTTTVKNAAGTTVSQETSTTTTSADGKSSTTETTTTAADGTVTETKTESSTAADGTVTNKTTGTETASDGTVTNIEKEETVSTAADGSKETKVEETKTDSDGNVVSQTSTTTTESRAADGTLTAETTGTTTDADGNVTTVNEKTETKTDPTTGTTTETKTVDNTTVDADGNDAGSEKGTVTSTTDADGNATKTTNMTVTDAEGNTTTTDTTSEYNAETNQTTTNGTVETKDAAGNTTASEEITNQTSAGDSASNSNTPAEQQAADDAGGTSEETTPETPVTPAVDEPIEFKMDDNATHENVVDASSAAATVTGGSGDDTFLINAAKMTATGSEYDSVTSLAVNGNAGKDTFKVTTDVTNSGYAGGVTLDGGAGDDTFELGVAASAAGLTITGGAGSDTVKLTAAGLDLSKVAFSDTIEKLDMDSKAATLAFDQLAKFTAVDNAGTVTLSAALTNSESLTGLKTDIQLTAAANTVTIGTTGAHSVTGGTDDDTFKLTASSVLKDGTLDGGSQNSADTLNVTGAVDLTTAASITGFENLTLAANTKVTMTADVLDGFTGAVTGADETSVIAFSGAAGTDSSSLTLKAIGTGGAYQLDGTAANYVTADAGGSIISVGAVPSGKSAAGSTITSGAGNDTVTLGAGSDTVIFAASNGVDKVNNFTSGASNDVLDFSNILTTAKVFSGALTGATEVADASAKLELTSITATGATHIDDGIFFANAVDADAVKALFGATDNTFTVTTSTGKAVVLAVSGADLSAVTSIDAYVVSTADGSEFTADKIATIGVAAGTADDFVAANVGVTIS